MQLCAKYLAGKHNSLADALSCSTYEWQHTGSSSGRSIRINDVYSGTSVQFSLPRSVHVRGRCLRTGLVTDEHLHQPTVCITSLGNKTTLSTRCDSDNHRSQVDQPTLVQRTQTHGGGPTNSSAHVKTNTRDYGKSRTT